MSYEPVTQFAKYTHEALADFIIMHPTASRDQIGRAFDRTPQWVSLVRSSNTFKEILARRVGACVDPVVQSSIEERSEALATRSLEVLMAKLEKPVEAISDEVAIAAAKLGLQAMGTGGFGRAVAPGPTAPPANRLEQLAGRLRNLNSGEIIDVQAVPAPSQTGPA